MEERQLAADVPIRPAATVMLLRDGSSGPEVFMLQRTHSAAFARGQYVFPGGRVDDADHGADYEPICDGLDDDAASARLGLDHGGLAWLVATIRECFEEAGVSCWRAIDRRRRGAVRPSPDVVTPPSRRPVTGCTTANRRSARTCAPNTPCCCSRDRPARVGRALDHAEG